MNKPLIIICVTIALDAIGLGLIFPILPQLIGDVTHAGNVAPYVGILIAIYAFMQFVFSPILGVLSDRLGRRRVLLISLAGAAINYGLMASASSLWLLIIGRAIGGITGANISIAMAYITDISSAAKRAQRFGLLNAMFGIGFIVGPILGGLLGCFSLRLPFMVAAILNAGNFLFALFILPESHKVKRAKVNFASFNPLSSLQWALSLKTLLPVIGTFFFLSAAGEVYGTCWALWGYDAFAWNGQWIGLSLGFFGVCQTLVQIFLPGIAVIWLGERGAVLTGITAACIAQTVMAFATQSWMVFIIIPIVVLAGIGTPTLQSIASRQVEESRQGQLQGVLASAMSLASILGPLLFSGIYSVVREQWPGAVWLSAIALNLLAVPLVLSLHVIPLRQLAEK